METSIRNFKFYDFGCGILYEDSRIKLFLVCWCSEENWYCRSVSKVHDAWFADEDRVRKTVGLLEEPVVKFPNAREVSYVDI
jgi:hypothetical protein